jgi:hypothetical protein
MSLNSLRARVAQAQRTTNPGLTIIRLVGGAQRPDECPHACIGEHVLFQQPHEEHEAFEERAIGLARALKATMIVLNLPPEDGYDG